jgi:RNA polymerase sigma factor (sigma-70 family)
MPDPDRFPSTRHSLILAVHRTELREEAVAAIVEIYWKPAYKYIRLKWNKSNDDAQDLTQEFFASLLDRDLLNKWDPARASFRTYLRLCIDGLVKNSITAQNRRRIENLDFAAAEREIAIADPGASPEELFHREWQRRLFELAIEDLRRECESSGREVRYQIFAQYDLASEPRPSYEDLANQHSIPLTTVTNHLAWARREIRRLVLDRLAQTTAGEDELNREARSLFR